MGTQGWQKQDLWEMLAPLASVLIKCVPFQAQSLARSLQAELEKLRLAEHAAASGKEEAQHLKVSWLCHDSKSHFQARLGARFIISEDWGARPMVTLQERAESSPVAKGQQGHSHCIPAGQDQCEVLSEHRMGFSHTGKPSSPSP